MAVLTIEEPGFGRCYRCKRVAVGGWFGKGKTREFICTRCIGTLLRRLVRLRNKSGDGP